MRFSRSDSRLPKSIVKPDRHYVKVQATGPNDYQSQLQDYLDEPSPTKPSEMMYTIESSEREVTGHKDFVLLSCSMKDYNAKQKENVDVANRRFNNVGPQEQISQGEPIGG